MRLSMTVTMAVSMVVLVASMLEAAESPGQVPFGDQISAKVFNYHRHRPAIATSGTLGVGAISELKNHGFKTILDLRTQAEGVDEESKAAIEAGLSYYNIPVGKDWPDDSMFHRFKTLVENRDNHPILIHCASGNRVGMVWAAYQLRNGFDHDTALIEGRTIGMKPGREAQLESHYVKNLAN